VSFAAPEGVDNAECPILLVEDNQDDILLILRAFRRARVDRRIQVVTSGTAALSYLKGVPPYDDRGKDGFEVLKWIRGQWDFFQLCVVMLTSSDLIRDVNQAYQLGANSFLVKPLDFENAAELARSLDMLIAKES
jgi:CheY-like chemotaxis protein